MILFCAKTISNVQTRDKHNGCDHVSERKYDFQHNKIREISVGFLISMRSICVLMNLDNISVEVQIYYSCFAIITVNTILFSFMPKPSPRNLYEIVFIVRLTTHLNNNIVVIIIHSICFNLIIHFVPENFKL